MLPGRAWVPEQFDAGSSQFYDGRWQVADGKADHWSGAEVFPARVLAAEDLDMAAIAKLVKERASNAADLEIQRFARKLRRVAYQHSPNLFPQLFMNPKED